MGEALGAVIAGRKERGQAALTFGTVYPFSCHTYELRYWMAACGIDPEADVQLVVVPPPLMVDNLRDGHVDGFCAGEPWNSLAVEAGLGRIVVSKSELWRRGVEKMLCVPHALAPEQPEVLAALIRALNRAARWGDDPTNRRHLAELLATPGYLDVPARIVERTLSGELVPVRGQPARLVPGLSSSCTGKGPTARRSIRHSGSTARCCAGTGPKLAWTTSRSCRRSSAPISTRRRSQAKPGRRRPHRRRRRVSLCLRILSSTAETGIGTIERSKTPPKI